MEINAVIKENVARLAERLASGHSEALTDYLRAAARFHNYSFGNTMLIALQCPHATRVAGFRTWNTFGRHVVKGAKGIRILAPIVRKKKEDENEERRFVAGFRSVCVFDVSQTDGDPLPDLNEHASGDAGNRLPDLYAFAESRGIKIEHSDAIAPALGISYGGKIALMTDLAPADEFCTLVHELAHELLHKQERGTKTIRETEAEAVAFVVGTAIGLNVPSVDYIHLYNGDVDVLTGSLVAIQSTAAAILESLHLGESPEVSE